MRLTPKYARLYRNTTLLTRPKTNLQDMTVEVDPGTPATGRLPSGATVPVSQTAPNIDFDQFLAGLDAETRAYLQLLLAGAGEGFGHNGKAFSATLKRFYPTARDIAQIAQQLEIRHANTARSIHNFRLLVEALGEKDTQLSQARRRLQRRVRGVRQAGTERREPPAPASRRPGQDQDGAGQDSPPPPKCWARRCTSSSPSLARSAPAQEATRRLAEQTTPIFKNEIRPFARQIEPVVKEIKPDTQQLIEAFPKLASSFAVINEFFNELAYNPGANTGRLPVLPRLGQPRPQQRAEHRRRPRGARSRPDLPQLQRRADPQRRRGSQPNGQPARRPAEPAQRSRVQGRRHPQTEAGAASAPRPSQACRPAACSRAWTRACSARRRPSATPASPLAASGGGD